MYNITIENGILNLNKVKAIKDTGYLEDDITNGVLTRLSEVPTKKEVNEIIKKVKGTAIGIHVWKLVPVNIPKAVKEQVKNNPW